MLSAEFTCGIILKWMIALICIASAISCTPLGYNSASFVLSLYSEVLRKLTTTSLDRWDSMLKTARNQLSKKDFDLVKNIGVTVPEKRADVASNVAYGKLKELTTMTRLAPIGHVVNLGAGKGGWNQFVASLQKVLSVTSYTFGSTKATPGHEVYAPINYKGKEKVREIYSDIRKLKPTLADSILFDAGELRADLSHEIKDSVTFWQETIIPWIKMNKDAYFCIKVIDAATPIITGFLEDVQRITGRGNLFRSTYSKATSNELYFISTRKVPLKSRIRIMYGLMLENIIKMEKPKKVTMAAPPKMEIKNKGYPLLQPLDLSVSYKQLGSVVSMHGNSYRHWISRGIFSFGSVGSTASIYNKWVAMVAGQLITTIAGVTFWKATDTTPKGFLRVFHQKVDTAPKEDSVYDNGLSSIYDKLAERFKREGFVYRELNKEELYTQMNKVGASSAYEESTNVRDFLNREDWYEQVQRARKALLSGKPIFGIFTGIGKREKKKTPIGTKGSRMVAYLPIVMRALEIQIFSAFMVLTHKEKLKFGVGGLGLHDVGQRVAETWRGAAISDDIAGFDTRIGVRRMSDEARFFCKLSGNNKIIEMMYRLYAYPNVLIPCEAPQGLVRSELVSGVGQRMSGTGPTYVANTITRTVLALGSICFAEQVPLEKWGNYSDGLMDDDSVQGNISGDDCNLSTTKERIVRWAESSGVLTEMGFPRKDVAPDSVSNIADCIENVEFCSHRYVPVSYYDSYNDVKVIKYRPSRMVSEIVGKSLIWLGTTGEAMDEMAWASAQSLNLLCNYHHLSTCKSLGLGLRSLVNPNIVLSDKGRFSIMPRPWMTSGKILDIINEVNFGSSSAYPVPGFRVRKIKHLGKYNLQEVFDPGFHEPIRAAWRKNLFYKVKSLILAHNTKGDISIMEEETVLFS